MILETFELSAPLNASLQVGDKVYYSPTVPGGAYSVFHTVDDYSTVVEFGVVTHLYPDGDLNALPLAIQPNSIVVAYDDISGISPPQANDYIMFAKDKEVNSSSLIGYYAEVTFQNESTNKVELFSVSSEVSESSK